MKIGPLYHYGSYATGSDSMINTTKYAFPYHYGSYATSIEQLENELTKTGFHTTMVLTQRAQIDIGDYIVYRFPYHYGSYATI